MIFFGTRAPWRTFSRRLVHFADDAMSGDKSKRNSVGRPKDSGAKDNKAKAQKDPKKAKDKDGDEEMTVVVPPAKGKKGEANVNGTSEDKAEEAPVDPKVQAATGD